jgi:tRNA A37 threonylcarbamoyladenosine synthetase subunit TsaC/SUA5/YrdC
MFKRIDISNTPHPEVVKEAVETLKKGGLVIFPTETMYGIGAEATNQKAINTLLEYKHQTLVLH